VSVGHLLVFVRLAVDFLPPTLLRVPHCGPHSCLHTFSRVSTPPPLSCSLLLFDLCPQVKSVVVAALPTTGPTTLGQCAVITSSTDGSTRVWDLSTGRPLAHPILTPTLRSLSAPAPSVGVAADGATPVLALAVNLSIQVLQPLSQEPVGVPCMGLSDSVASVALGPCGEDAPWLLASGDVAGAVRLWDVSTGQPACAPVVAAHGPVQSIAFGPRAAGAPLWLAAAAEDAKVPSYYCLSPHK
jgi:WD40 repeat protein